jgi:hypothetical protein
VNKNTVEKILLKGTPKQRALLIANHLSEANLGKKGFLTDSELAALTDSFESELELKVYRTFKRRHEFVSAFLANLSQARLSYKEVLERLEKFLLIRMGNDDFEDVVNNLLDLIPDKKTKAKGLTLVKSYQRFPLYRFIKPDEAGLIRIDDNRLDEIIEQLRKRVNQEQISLKTSIQALKDYMEETGFNVTVFKMFLKEVEHWAKSQKGMTLTLMSSLARGPMGVRLDTFENNGITQLREKHKLEADYASVQIDKDVYDRLRREELNA